MTRKVVRDGQDEKHGTSRPGWDVLVQDGVPGAGLAGHETKLYSLADTSFVILDVTCSKLLLPKSI